MAAPDPRISIIVPVHNGRSTIRRCIESLLALRHPSYEIIVVDDGSTDDSADICRSYGVKVIRVEQGGPSGARNIGIAEAAGELIAFTDDDCIVHPQWLSELEHAFSAPDIGGAGGDQMSPNDETRFGRDIQDYFKSVGFMTGYVKNYRRLIETDHNPSCNAMYRKDVLTEVGGFDEMLFPSEDVDLDYKIIRNGYRILFNPAAVVAHYRPQSYRSFMRMMYKYGSSQRYLVKQYGLFRTLHYVPGVLIAGIVLTAVLLGLYPAMWPVVLLPPVLVSGWFFVRARSIRRTAVFTLLFMLTLVCWNAGFIMGYRPPFVPRARHDEACRGTFRASGK